MLDSERLLQNWKENRKIVLAIGFVGTIFPDADRSMTQCKKTIDLIKTCQYEGAYVMIHTTKAPDEYDKIRTYCNDNGIRVSTINKNVFAKHNEGKHGRPIYDWSLDIVSGLPYTQSILEMVLNKYQDYKSKVKKLEEDFTNGLH